MSRKSALAVRRRQRRAGLIAASARVAHQALLDRRQPPEISAITAARTTAGARDRSRPTASSRPTEVRHRGLASPMASSQRLPPAVTDHAEGRGRPANAGHRPCRAPAAPRHRLARSVRARRRNPDRRTAALCRPILPASDKLPRRRSGKRRARASRPPNTKSAIRQIEGRGVPQNTEDGLRWLERAAKAGLAPAQFRLGGLYEKGIGVKKNLDDRAPPLHGRGRKGQRQGHAQSRRALCRRHRRQAGLQDRGRMVPQARPTTASPTASTISAILYARGIGVDQNLAESYKWFALAAIQGDNDAAKKRDEVAARLDAASLAAARLAVQTFDAAAAARRRRHRHGAARRLGSAAAADSAARPRSQARQCPCASPRLNATRQNRTSRDKSCRLIRRSPVRMSQTRRHSAAARRIICRDGRAGL